MTHGSHRDEQLHLAPRGCHSRTGPVRVEVISVGRDLLSGRTPDRNGQVLAEHIHRRGGTVERITVVDDDHSAIATAVREALERKIHLLICSGGLGPAPDDHTRGAVSEVLSVPLSGNVDARTMVEATYERMAKNHQVPSGGINAARETLYMLPLGSVAVANDLGIAPGFVSRLAGGTVVLCLPGRPDEAMSVWKAAGEGLKDVLPSHERIHREIESPTADESSLRPLLEKLAGEFPDIWFSSHPSDTRKKGSRIIIDVEASGPTREEASAAVNEAQRRLIALASGPKS